MAIAFNAKTLATQTGAGSTSTTFSHTCTGSDRFLIVSCRTSNWTAGNPTNITATYNGVSMTAISINVQVYLTSNNWRWHSFYIVNPASGANNVVITTTGGSGILRGLAASYTGVDQASPVLTSNTGAGGDTGNTMTISLTTAQSAWWFISGANVDANWTAGANTATIREVDGGCGCADSNGNISAQTGNAQLSHTGSRGYGGIAIAFKESSGGSAANQNLALMGVGS